jgi:hypothetical protein
MIRTLGQTGVPVIFEALNADALSQSKTSLSKVGYSVKQIDNVNFLAEHSKVAAQG